MKPWKLALIIWGPILLIAVIYGIFYLAHYDHAKSILNKYQATYNNCNNENQNSAEPLFQPNDNSGPSINQVFNCIPSGSISHGFLWLPKYRQ